MITYLCKYTPLELLAALGADLSEPNSDVEDFRTADAMVHSSLCTHAKMLIEQLAEDNARPDGLVLTNCCDSIRRVYDTLAADSSETGLSRFGFTAMLDLPHTNLTHGIQAYARELITLKERYEAWSGKAFDRTLFLEKWKKAADDWSDFRKREEPYLAIMGARVSNELRAKIRSSMPCPVIDLTCGGLRSIPAPPERAFILPSERDCEKTDSKTENRPLSLSPPSLGSCPPSSMTDEELLTAYAEALLSQVPCTRMDDKSLRADLLRSPHLLGVVYHSIKFCDYYSFEYADIRHASSLPVLKIESDYTSQSEGQLATRISAFAESLPIRHKGEIMEHQETRTRDPEDVFVGIDSGSTSTNVAAIDREGNLLASSIIRTGARAGSAAERAYADVQRKLGGRASHIRFVMATGYGREFIPFADDTKTEISCHAKGAHATVPAARCVIDIGGQDSKVICLDEDGHVVNFVMNDKCAAGTGRFLEMMAHTLELSMDEMSKKGHRWKKDLTISSTCTVFAESEVVGLIAENTGADEIVHALNKSVAMKTCGMVKRVRGAGPFMMTGGVARNSGVVREIEERLGEPLAITEYPDLTGAIGAALFAAEA